MQSTRRRPHTHVLLQRYIVESERAKREAWTTDDPPSLKLRRDKEAGNVIRRGEWSALGSCDIDHTTRGARVRERDAIESIRAADSRIGDS